MYVYPQHMPVNIPDVSTIEKLHFQQLQNNLQQQTPVVNHVDLVLPNLFKIHSLHHIESPIKVCGSEREPEQVVCEQNCAQEELAVNDVNAANSATISNNNNNSVTSEKSVEVCDSERTRPAVVILSGDASKEVSGITFGFDINEQLLCGDVCSDFVARYFVPETINTKFYNHEKLVNYIGGGKSK